MGLENLDILGAISQVGFPIFVAVFSLFKLNKTIEENTKVLTVIATKIDLKEDEK